MISKADTLRDREAVADSLYVNLLDIDEGQTGHNKTSIVNNDVKTLLKNLEKLLWTELTKWWEKKS